MLSTSQTPNPLVLRTHAAAQEGRCGPGWVFFWSRLLFCFGTQELAGSSPPPAAVSSRDRSHIISLLTINKAVGCRELLRDHNAV